jgi:tetratricopeptide (TPR) repeat protein
LLSAGRAKDALEVCAKRLSSEPDDAGALAAQGDAHMALGDRDAAKAAWLAAEALGDGNASNARRAAFGPERGMDHFDEALALLDRRLTNDAIAEFETACDKLRKEIRVPGDQPHRYLAKSLYNSAFLRELQVDDSVIEPNFREAVELDPSYAEAMLALGNLCLRTDRVDEGLEWFARAGKADPSAGQPWFYRARHYSGLDDFERTVEDATKAFEAYSRRGQGQFAADAIMMRGQANEALGKLQAAKADYDTAYDYGHPTGFAMGDNIRQRIAIEDPKSDEAYELLDKVAQRLQRNECPWGQIEFLDARVAGNEKAMALVAKLKKDEALEEEQTSWLVELLQS